MDVQENIIKMLEPIPTEVLKEEIKRRSKADRCNRERPKVEYGYFVGVVEKINNISFEYLNKVKYKPYALWEFQIKDVISHEKELEQYWYIFQGRTSTFRCALPKKDAPMVGDKVKLKYRKTKSFSLYNIRKAKIVEIIKD